MPLVRQIKHERLRLQWLVATPLPTYQISLAGLTPSTWAGPTAKWRGQTVASLMRRTLMR